ncbi:hypothetical protein [Psychrobacter submarinus]|uniref:hypothetical protein n=1 Tax=Psychrobacter submarinus TaxID=154108 RepID=UPI00191ACC46|nr:hypothetical protein [Psychrobacter submarinus]
MTANSTSNCSESLTNNIVQEADNKLQKKRKSFVALYRPHKEISVLSEVGFIVIEDGWDEQSLLALKQQTGLGTLFGLQTSDKHIEKFEIIDRMIICKADEVEQVISVFESVLLHQGMMGIVYRDIILPWGADKAARYIQTKVTGMPSAKLLEYAVNNLLKQTPKSLNIKSMVLNIESGHKISEDEFSGVPDVIYSQISDDAEVFYGPRVTDKPNYYRLEAIYVAG